MILLNDILDIESLSIHPHRNEEIEGIGTGQIIRAELTDPLWRVNITTPISEFNDGRKIRAVLNDMNRPNSYFRVYDPISQFASNDPNGTLLQNVEIGGKFGNQIEFSGQPAGYVFEAGDAFHILHAGRHYYFEISQSGVNFTRTTPTVPSSIPEGASCIFVKPQIRVQMIPDELQIAGADSSMWKMTSFQISAVQKIA